jgi:hypothetical protein
MRIRFRMRVDQLDYLAGQSRERGRLGRLGPVK